MFSPKYAVPVFGYVIPPLALVILLMNGAMVWTLCKRNMRSPVNSLLISIAISDTLAICLPTAPFIYFYTMGHYKEYIPFTWCRVFFNLVHVLPLFCNMASLWSTVALAGFRCYSVWRPLHVKATITNFRTNICIVLIYILAFVVYCPVMFEYTYTLVTTPSKMDGNATTRACTMKRNESYNNEHFTSIHTWVQIVFTSLLPWLLIAFPDFGLLWKLKKADAEINGATEKPMLFRNKQVSRRRMMTWMIFLVVSMVWMVEIPFAVSFAKYMANSNGDVMSNRLGNQVIFICLLKYVTYPAILVIYCFMSEKFRKEFIAVFICKKDANVPKATPNVSRRRTTSNTQSSGYSKNDPSA